MNETLDNAPCGFLTFNDQGMITQANATVSRMLGYSVLEISEMSFDHILPVGSRIFHQTHLSPLLKLNGFVNEVYLTVKTKTGNELPVIMNAVVNEREGTFVTDCVFVQMKERGEYEGAILRAKRIAEDAVQSKDQFISTVSHELRTPLNSMFGWLHILEVSRTDPVMLEKGLSAISRGAKSLKTLIEDLIDFSQINAGRFKLSLERVNVADVVNSAIDTVRHSADAKSIAVLINIDPDGPAVSGDPARLQQILWNLLSNAIKFTPKEGEVKIDLGRVNSSVEISIRDNGVGISDSFLPYVFDRFQQEKSDSGNRGGGLGIGMAITRQLVELHGGTIHVESAGEGEGTTFTVRLPVMIINRAEPLRISELEGDPTVSSPRTLLGLHVLIVEDDSQARTMLTNLLEQSGAEVSSAGSFVDGMKLFNSLRPDAIVCDIELPDGDGYSFIKEVRKLEMEGQGFTPAIALTALARPDDRVKALAAGFHTYFTKPIEPIELLLAVTNLTNRIVSPKLKAER